MRTDDDLRAWRDAARSGGFPTPTRKRWQPLRAGVVNLWEFEVAEYWYADGWAQLMGRNETGKSSLMALTTLIPWLGDTSSTNIDTLGRSGKQFAYYVRPIGTDGDRRDASASFFHGWLWVEYGRVTDTGPRFFTTLLYSSARTGSQKVALEWCTCESSRVREALRLTAGRDVLPPKAIEAPGFFPYPSGQLYKAAVAERLLGSTVDRLETIGKILKVTRTPKLGAQLDVRFVTDHLRDSLPALRQGEIDQLAQGWDQLDQIRNDLERARRAAERVARLAERSWRPWLRARLRIDADDAAAQRTGFDRVTREEETAKATLTTAEARDSDLARLADAASLSAASVRAAAEQLLESAAYKDASTRIENARRAEEDMRRAGSDRDAARDGAHRADKRAADAAEAAQTEVDLADEARQQAQGAAGEVRRTAGLAGMPPSETLDPGRLLQSTEQRRQATDRALGLLRVAEDAQSAAAQQEALAGAAATSADEANTKAEGAWADAEAEHEALVANIEAWAAIAPQPVHRFAAWIEALPRATGDLSAPLLTDIIRAEWYEPLRTEFEQRRVAAATAKESALTEANRLRHDISELKGAGVAPPPSPTLWHRRSRAGVSGAPLWRLLNPVPAATDAEVAHIEAALAAAGLLDAWVEPGGAHGLDTFAVSPDNPGDGLRLSALLCVADDAGSLGAAAQAVLDGVALRRADESLPAAGVAVAVDGRWRNSALEGTAAPTHEAAEWLGESAREAQRRRRLTELTAQIATAEEEAAAHEAGRAEAQAALDAVAGAVRHAPSDAELRRRLGATGILADVAEEARAAAAKSQERARDARASAETRQAELLRFANEHRLPHTREDISQVVAALQDLRAALRTLQRENEAVALSERRADHARSKLEELQDERAEAQRRHAEAERALGVAEARSEAMRSAVDADDQTVLDELGRLQRTAKDASDEAGRHETERIKVSADVGAAREHLRSVEELRQSATRERDRAYRRFRSLIDRGVADDLGLPLTEPHSSSVEHVRAQVAEVRRAVNPGRQWRDGDPEANAHVLQRLRSGLEGDAREARDELEQGGRSLQLEPADDLVRIEVTVNSNGTTQPLREATTTLSNTVTMLSEAYDARVQQTLDDLLGSTFLEHMRERIGRTEKLIHDINIVLLQHATSTSDTALRIRLEPGQNRAVLDTFRRKGGLLDPDVAGQVRDFLRTRVDEAKRQATDEGQADWRDALARQLDYRAWYEIHLERRVGKGGNWGPLNTRSFALLSGGARAVMLMLPLVATLSALYQEMSGAPRPLWLDEAFDGLDVPNRSMVMDLLREFDFDVLVAGPGRLVNVAVVPAAAIYQVVRAPEPVPGADLTLELWAGGTLEAIDLPLSWLEPSPAVPPDQDALL
ncbi:SbcC/MukB-like Walker B domain-containing protein [Propionicicella superfundia]|uniref:SbcC/MukB-like Walker B domain-containing protein n=1 Tax=Propionicicella superfundia TaxID=348582 RepID=UPI000408A716|nr:SbcC/MukB-like Walker B domain-containing protein [Propionicicella superfundia]